MTQRVRQRLPIALMSGLLFAVVLLIGYQIADLSSGWQLALAGVAAVVAFSTPDVVVWLRTRRSRKRDDTRPGAHA